MNRERTAKENAQNKNFIERFYDARCFFSKLKAFLAGS